MWDHPALRATRDFRVWKRPPPPPSDEPIPGPADSPALMADKPRDVQIAGKYLESFYLAGGGGRVVMLLAPRASKSSREVERRECARLSAELWGYVASVAFVLSPAPAVLLFTSDFGIHDAQLFCYWDFILC